MLIELSIKNLAIVKELHLEFINGMHVITGETGAGKSIIINALNALLGKTLSPKEIRPQADFLEIIGKFDISDLPQLNAILQECGTQVDAEGCCIIRRVIKQNKPSKAYINGTIVPLSQLKDVAQHLVQIHSQHQSLTLLDLSQQRKMLDTFANHPDKLANVAQAYSALQEVETQINSVKNSIERQEKMELLSYQIQELENLNIQESEVETLELEFKQLSNIDKTAHDANLILTALDNADESVLNKLHDFMTLSNNFTNANVAHNLNTAIISLEEARNDLVSFIDNLDCSPARLQEVEQRMSQVYDLARKLKVKPKELFSKYQVMQQELSAMQHSNELLAQLLATRDKLVKDYLEKAKDLSIARSQAASNLINLVLTKVQALDLAKAQFTIKISTDDLAKLKYSPHGIDTVEFLATTNPGQSLSNLKNLSGGELSRFSLALLAINGAMQKIPMMVFDEIDSGISGKTAELVGGMLQTIAANAQLVCITHLPQVAAKGTLNFKVSKIQNELETNTQIQVLSRGEKIEEIARLIGGATITDSAKAFAQELIET